MKHGLLAELRRRHVYRVAVAYVVVGWLLIEVATQVFPVFHMPDWAAQLVVFLIVLGFPITLVIAWAFEITPEGVRRTEPADSPEARRPDQHHRVGRILNFAITGSLVIAVAWLVWRSWTPRHIVPKPLPAAASASSGIPSALSSPAPSVPAIPKKSIAVLPFENLSTDKANAYFADGMQDLILTKLADIGDLKVISRTSTMQYGSHPQNLKRIGQELGVATLLEGSVQKAGDQVLVNVQLINAGNDSHIWANSYQRTLKNVFGVEGEVAEKIATTLNATLTAPETHQLAIAPTTNPAAYDAYVRARASANLAGSQNHAPLKREIAAYRDAVTHDPRFALAWAQLASAELSDYWLFEPTPAVLASARQALEKARALAPDAAATQLALGDFDYYGQTDYRHALVAFQNVLKRVPNNVAALRRAARIERRTGRMQAAVSYYQRAIVLDPLNVGLLGEAANTFTSMRDFPRARMLVDRALAIDPESAGMVMIMVGIDEAEGRFTAAGKLLAKVKPNMNTRAAMVFERVFVRDYADAVRMARAALADPSCHESARNLGGCYLQLGYVEYLAGKKAASRADVRHAMANLHTVLEQSPSRLAKANAHILLGYAETLLGKKTAALAAAHKAVALMPSSKDAMDGPAIQEGLARIEAMVGERDAAIGLLRHLLAIPYDNAITVSILRADPNFDRLRTDPRFQALLEKYEKSRPEPVPTVAGR